MSVELTTKLLSDTQFLDFVKLHVSNASMII